MKRHVADFVRRCLTCQQVKVEHQRSIGLLQPLEVVEWKWEHITMDFVTHLPRTSRKHDTVWVIVPQLTKPAHLLAMRMTFTLEEFCRIYMRDCSVTWSANIYRIGPGSQVYGSVLEEFPESHGNTIDDEHYFSSTNRHSVRKTYTGFGIHATRMRPGSQG